jgi:hypothetical protein
MLKDYPILHARVSLVWMTSIWQLVFDVLVGALKWLENVQSNLKN